MGRDFKVAGGEVGIPEAKTTKGVTTLRGPVFVDLERSVSLLARIQDKTRKVDSRASEASNGR